MPDLSQPYAIYSDDVGNQFILQNGHYFRKTVGYPEVLTLPPTNGPAPVSTNPVPVIANLVFRLSADAGVSATSNAVDSWTDQVSGASFTATTTARPTYMANVLGGKPSIRFDGVNNIMQGGRPSALVTAIDSQNCTVVVVFKAIAGTGNKAIFSASAGGNSLIMQGSTNLVNRYSNGDRAPPISSTSFLVAGYTSTKPYSLGSGNGLERSYLQGGCYASSVTEAPTSGGNNFAVGALTGGAFKVNADIFEILVWNTALTPLQMLQVQTWACTKYGQALPWAGAAKFDIYDGNSLTAGVGSGAAGAITVADCYPYVSATARGLTYGQWTMVAVGGITQANMGSKFSEWSGIPAYLGTIPVKVASFEYYNSKAVAPATLLASVTSYAASVRALPNTKLALASSLSSSSDPDANRVTFNANLVANQATLCDTLVQIDTDVNIGAATAFATNGAGAGLNLWSDIVHLNGTGYSTYLSPLMTTGLNLI